MMENDLGVLYKYGFWVPAVFRYLAPNFFPIFFSLFRGTRGSGLVQGP